MSYVHRSLVAAVCVLALSSCSEGASDRGGSVEGGSGGIDTAGRGGGSQGAVGGGGTGGAITMTGGTSVGGSGGSGQGGASGAPVGGTAGAGQLPALDSGAPDGASRPGSGGGAGAGAGGTGGSAPSDGGALDGGPSDPFAGCPVATDYVGSAAWTHTAQASSGAVYCGTFNEGRTLVEELAVKAMFRIAEGAYPLPESGAGHAFRLPACVRFASGPALSLDVGTADFVSAGSALRHSFTQQTEAPDSRIFQGSLSIAAGGTDTLLLDGSEVDTAGLDSFMFTLCNASDECFALDAIRFDSCTHSGSTLHRHTVGFGAAGSVVLDLRIGSSFAGTEPGAFVRATGTYEGVAFDVTDYFRLIYNPEHHHFTRDFAVLFDAPIAGACGIEVGGLEPDYGSGTPEDMTPDFAYSVDCTLKRLSTLTVTSHTHARP